MGDTCSAVPARLMTYGSRGQQNDGDLKASGSRVSGAIHALLASKPDPAVLPRLEDVGGDLTSYAVRKQGVDQWVWDVGVAFLSAGERQISAQLGPEAAEHYDGTNLVTTDSSVVDAGLRVEAGFYKDQAEALRLALDNDHWEKVRQIVASLSLMKDDPVAMAAFFDTLGPGDTLKTWAIVHQMYPDLVQQYDVALGTATRSPTWDPNFTRQLLDPGKYMQPGNNDPMLLNPNWIPELVQYGVFSTDFLTRMGDSVLLDPRGVLVDPHTPAAQLIFDALARNPDAASAYLMGRDPTGQMQYDPHLPPPTRLRHFLDLGTKYEFPNHDAAPGYFVPDGTWPALGDATFAADLSASDHKQILQEIGLVNWSMVPDPYRGVVAQLISAHIDLLPWDQAHPMPAWEPNLFTTAEINFDGEVDQRRVQQIAAAVAQWTVDHPPSGVDDPALTIWLRNVGQLRAIVLAGLSQHTRVLEEAAAELDTMTTAAVIVALPFLPEVEAGGVIVATTFDIAEGAIAEMGRRQAMADLTQSNAGPAADLPAYADALAKARAQALIVLYATDPKHDWIPKDLRGLPLSDPGLQAFLGQVAAARDITGIDPKYAHTPALDHVIQEMDTLQSGFQDQQIWQQVGRH